MPPLPILRPLAAEQLDFYNSQLTEDSEYRMRNSITQHNQQSPTEIASLPANLAPERSHKTIQGKRTGAAGTHKSVYRKVSPYFEQLKEHIRQEKLKSAAELSDTDVRHLQKKWLLENVFRNGYPTIKNGTPVHEFVTFYDLDRQDLECIDAISEVEAGNLPTFEHFSLIFSVLCHLNDKVSDPDKLCMPRTSRIDAIRAELLEPGKTTAPDGYADDNTASWTHEVKHSYRILSTDPYSPQYNLVAKLSKEKNKDGPESISLSIQYPLETVYRVIMQNHIQRVEKEGRLEIKHLSRDSTQKAIRGDNKTKRYDSIPTQIIKDFVAACPGCKDDRKREARKQGAKTTKANGGNRGQKNRTNSPKKRRAESDPEEDSYPPSKKRATTIPGLPMGNNQGPSGSFSQRNPSMQYTNSFINPGDEFSQQPLQQQQQPEVMGYPVGTLPSDIPPYQIDIPNDDYPWWEQQPPIFSEAATQYYNPSQKPTLSFGFQSKSDLPIEPNYSDFAHDPVFDGYPLNYQQQNIGNDQSATVDPGLLSNFVNGNNLDNVQQPATVTGDFHDDYFDWQKYLHEDDQLPAMGSEEDPDNNLTQTHQSLSLEDALKRADKERSTREISTEQQLLRQPSPDYFYNAFENFHGDGNKPESYDLPNDQLEEFLKTQLSAFLQDSSPPPNS